MSRDLKDRFYKWFTAKKGKQDIWDWFVPFLALEIPDEQERKKALVDIWDKLESLIESPSEKSKEEFKQFIRQCKNEWESEIIESIEEWRRIESIIVNPKKLDTGTEQEPPSQQERIEQLQIQLAGCGVAALGGTKEPAKRGDFGWSPCYQDVLDLRIKYEALEIQDSQIEKLSPADLPELPEELRLSNIIGEGMTQIEQNIGDRDARQAINQLIKWAKVMEKKLVDKT